MEDKKGLVIGIIILVIICIILAGRGISSKTLKDDKTKKKDTKVETKNLVNYKQIDIESVSQELLDKLNESMYIDGTNISLFFDSDKTVDSIDGEDLVSYTLSKYGEEQKWSEKIYKEKQKKSKLPEKLITVKKSVIENEMYKLFNVNKKLLLEDESVYNYLFYDVMYSVEDDSFYIPTGVTKETYYPLLIHTSDYYVEKDILYLYDYVLECDFTSDVVCYNKSNKDKGPVIANKRTKKTNSNTIIDSKIDDSGTLNTSYIFEKYSDKFDTYRVGFKLGEDDKYYWQSTESVLIKNNE